MAKKRRRRKKRYEEDEFDLPEWAVNPETKRGILVIFLFAAAALAALSYFNIAGPLGGWIDQFLTGLFGWNRLLFVVVLTILGFKALMPDRLQMGGIGAIGFILIIFSINGFIQLLTMAINPEQTPWSEGGGLIGMFFAYPLVSVMGMIAAGVVLIALLVASLLLTFNLTLAHMAVLGAPIRWIMGKSAQDNYGDEEEEEEWDEEVEEEEELEDEEVDEEDEEPSPIFDTKTVDVSVESSEQPLLADSSKKRRKIAVPLDLLNKQSGKPKSGDIERIKERIRVTFEQFGIPVEMVGVSVGPTVTQYTLRPSEGIKLTRITSLSNDLALALAAHPIRIEAPIPGKSLVGIEVPNQSAAIVTLREVMESSEFRTAKHPLTITLGKDVSGKSWVASIAKMPHLLVAGATGSGKSVCLNSIITSLLYGNSPDKIRFIMVDPKRVELPVYNGIPHLITPVITDIPKTVNALKWTIGEMERRFDLLSKARSRDISSYNAKAPQKLPYIVIIIDELADLMVSAAAEVEGAIVRIAQMARAVGIHLVLATQRPSVDVITGLIKANIPARIAFSVASLVDSRTILDSSGAEKLLGRGDMLYITADLSKPKRIQGTFITEDETKRVTDFIKDKYGSVEYVDGITEKQSLYGSPTSFKDAEDDLYDEAKATVVQAGKASASYLQRRLKVGYARAARLIDMLEEAGVVGPGDGAKPREILIDAIDLDSVSDEEEEWVEEGEEGETEERYDEETEDEVDEDETDEEEEEYPEEEEDGEEVDKIEDDEDERYE